MEAYPLTLGMNVVGLTIHPPLPRLTGLLTLPPLQLQGVILPASRG